MKRFVFFCLCMQLMSCSSSNQNDTTTLQTSHLVDKLEKDIEHLQLKSADLQNRNLGLQNQTAFLQKEVHEMKHALKQMKELKQLLFLIEKKQALLERSAQFKNQKLDLLHSELNKLSRFFEKIDSPKNLCLDHLSTSSQLKSDRTNHPS